MAADESTIDDMVAESSLQLWAAAQTDFDPFQVPSAEWPDETVPVRDADIAVDARLEVDDVRDSLDRLDGSGSWWVATPARGACSARSLRTLRSRKTAGGSPST